MYCRYRFGQVKNYLKVILIEMKNRITKLFESKRKNILSVFFTAGYPKRQDTIAIAEHLKRAGVDMIEIGIPFSDPIADGPIIQESNKTALDQGMSVALLLQQVSELRSKIEIPVVLMGYLNPVMQYGIEKFFKDAAKVGVDGLILPDLPLEEYELHYKSLCESLNLSISFLISPTTSEKRIRKIDTLSSGFIYAVSSSSTTGAKQEFSAKQCSYFERLDTMKLKNPFLIGFGISNKKTYQQACEYSAGAIIGSSFITSLKSATDLSVDVEKFVLALRT
jgi:tryptophan synthase alpha chain